MKPMNVAAEVHCSMNCATDLPVKRYSSGPPTGIVQRTRSLYGILAVPNRSRPWACVALPCLAKTKNMSFPTAPTSFAYTSSKRTPLQRGPGLAINAVIAKMLFHV